MATTTRRINATPEQVFAVLANGWLYATWVVGATRIRDVEPDWPKTGARIHHSVGVWPLVLDDSTSVLEWDPPRRLRLRARGWPIGEAEVTIEAQPRPEGCVVRITEDATEGPGRMVPLPVRSVLLGVRNTETLRRLAFLAEGGAR